MTINVDTSAKNIPHVKNIIFGILLHVVAKMANIGKYNGKYYWQFMVTCDEVIDL